MNEQQKCTKCHQIIKNGECYCNCHIRKIAFLPAYRIPRHRYFEACMYGMRIGMNDYRDENSDCSATKETKS